MGSGVETKLNNMEVKIYVTWGCLIGLVEHLLPWTNT